MRLLLVMLLIIGSTCLYAQTKKIAFKSHSGTPENFRIALSDNMFDMDDSNFGEYIRRDVINAALDSVIFISDSVAVMVTTEYCRGEDEPETRAKRWRAGTDTVRHHPLFSQKHALDSIRYILKTMYNFKNPVNETVFIGYDNYTLRNQADTCLKRSPEYFTNTELSSVPGSNGGNGMIPMSILGVAAISLLSALIARRNPHHISIK